MDDNDNNTIIIRAGVAIGQAYLGRWPLEREFPTDYITPTTTPPQKTLHCGADAVANERLARLWIGILLSGHRVK